MVQPEVIRRRLSRLEEYLAFLEERRRYTYEEFLADPERYASIERFLHLAAAFARYL